MKTYLSTLSIDGTFAKGSNPLPIFRDPIKDKESKSDGTLSAVELENLGKETGYRVLPYRLADRYDRKKKPIQLKTVILENDLVKVTFLPEQGGRLYSMINKETGHDVFLRNPVYQPCNLGILDAWFSGGVEWNIAQYGHTFTSNSPVFFAKVVDNDYEFVRMYDYERCKKVFYHIDFHLPDGSTILYAHVHIINDDNYSKPFYWWTNAAIPDNRNVRVFSGTDEVMFLRPESIGNNINPVRIFGHAKLPYLPTLEGKDSSYPVNSNYANEFFFQNSEVENAPWSAAAYNDGTIYFDRSTQPLRYRKMFCWGSHRGGRRWCDYLSIPGENSHYIELQAGLAPTQLNGITIKAGESWQFTQAFGLTQFSELSAPYDENWNTSKEYIAKKIDTALSEGILLENHRNFISLATNPATEILSIGSGYGALESIRRSIFQAHNTPTMITFPQSTIGQEQLPWLELLRTGIMPEQSPLSIPASWMIDEAWRPLLEKSIQIKEGMTAHLHLGVLEYENFNFEKGIYHWNKSLELQKNPWALRNLAVVRKRQNELDEAIILMQEAVALENFSIDKSFTEEYFDLLIEAKKYEDLWDMYLNLPSERKNVDRIIMQAGYAAVELDKTQFVEDLEEKEFSNIREGDNLLVDMWFKFTAKKEAKSHGIPYSDDIYKEVRATKLPPSNFDFRMVDN